MIVSNWPIRIFSITFYRSSNFHLEWHSLPLIMKKGYGSGVKIDDNWEKSSTVEMRTSDNINKTIPLSAKCITSKAGSCNVGVEYLKVDFIFVRSRTSFLAQTMLPTILLVTAGFGSLFVPPDLVPGRMTLAITTCLTLIAMMSSALNHAPTTSYMKVRTDNSWCNISGSIHLEIFRHLTFGSSPASASTS